MEQVVKHMTHWLLKKHLIVPEQSEWCHYMLMQSTMSILSLCLLLPVSAAIVGVWGSVFYTATFRILRQRTGGYPVLFTVTEEGCKAFAPDFPKIQIQAGTMETALMEAKKQIQKALSQFKYPPIPTRQEDIVVPENSVLILLKTA